MIFDIKAAKIISSFLIYFLYLDNDLQINLSYYYYNK